MITTKIPLHISNSKWKRLYFKSTLISPAYGGVSNKSHTHTPYTSAVLSSSSPQAIEILYFIYECVCVCVLDDQLDECVCDVNVQVHA